MKSIFWVDLPNPYNIEREWINIETFYSQREAIEFCKKHFGADNKGRIRLINEGEEEDE